MPKDKLVTPIDKLAKEEYERFLEDVGKATKPIELELLLNKHILGDLDVREELLAIKDALFVGRLTDGRRLPVEKARFLLEHVFYPRLLRAKAAGYDGMEHRVHLGIGTSADSHAVQLPVDDVLKEAGYGEAA